MIDSLLRLAERKYVDCRSSSGADERRPPAAGVVAVPGRLDLDHPGAEVAEHHRGVRAGEGAGEVDDEDVRPAARVIAVTSPAARGRPRRAAVRPASTITL